MRLNTSMMPIEPQAEQGFGLSRAPDQVKLQIGQSPRPVGSPGRAKPLAG